MSDVAATTIDWLGAERVLQLAVAAIRAAEDADWLRTAGLTARAIKADDAASVRFADAYCIHSRAALELEATGHLREALLQAIQRQ